jgi:hypothetical protein
MTSMRNCSLDSTGWRMYTYNFKYKLFDEVIVKELGVSGRVDTLSLSYLGEQYRVVYWYAGERCEEWVYDWELKHVSS